MVRATPTPNEIDTVIKQLEMAERPLLIAGGMLSDAPGRIALARAAEAHHLPVALTFKYQEIFDNESPLFAGQFGFKVPKPLIDALSQADLVLAVGTRLGDTPTQGYVFPAAPVPSQPLIHFYPDPAVLGSIHANTIGLQCDPDSFLDAMAARNCAIKGNREAWIGGLNKVARQLRNVARQPRNDGVDFGVVVGEFAARAPQDAIVTTDAGNFHHGLTAFGPGTTPRPALALWVAPWVVVPGAIAACLREPDRSVICFTGDGGVMMTGNELATAMATGAKPKIIISNNGSYGTIRLHQERDHPRRISAIELCKPDFAAWGLSFGALGLVISEPDRAAGAVAKALAHDGPVVIDVKSSVEAISAYTTITKLRGEEQAESPI